MKLSRNLICLLLAVFLCTQLLPACTSNSLEEDTPESSANQEPPNESSQTSEPTKLTNDDVIIDSIEELDGMMQVLANGDSFYTPSVEHCVANTEQTVLYYNNLLLVYTEGDLSASEREELSNSIGGKPMGVISGAIHAFQIMVPDTTLEELSYLADKLMANQRVLYVCCEYPVQIMSEEKDDNPWQFADDPTDIRGNEVDPGGCDWWAEAIGAYTAWEYTDLCNEVRVGIIDDGFLDSHEDLEGKISFVSNDRFNTAAFHGTLVAGIIGASNNDVGIRGIADTAILYCADLWPTDSPNSYHTLAEYLAVVNYMAQSKVCVINNSWGCIVPSQKSYVESIYHGAEENAEAEYSQWLDLRVMRDLIPTAEFVVVMISQLFSSGYEDLIHVQGAGNDATDARYNGFFSAVTEQVYNNMAPTVLSKLSGSGITYELIDERIFVVGSVQNYREKNGNYALSIFSNYGDSVDICAPGDGILSTTTYEFETYYDYAWGTSMSAPMVTASVAFLRSLNPELSVTELRQILLDSSEVQAVGFGYKYPMLNVGAAVKTVISKIDTSTDNAF